MNFIGEHLLPGQIGQFSIYLAFVTALLSSFSYFKSIKSEDQSWIKIARTSFVLHALSIIIIVGSMAFMIFNQYFEYQYVWKHSSKALPLEFIISCFWEGQEGSFLLWIFWHIVLGMILLFKRSKWEAPVLMVVALVQVFLVSMVMGIYIGDFQIGTTPFILVRELPEYINMPFMQMPDYLNNPQFADGRGLNPLLQNYWMVIHPPILFLGFALTLIPFAYALGGLIIGKYKSWIKPAIPWAFAGVMILGLGILLGGVWAYESLTFGGFWAWDPVENSSLVPWLILLGAAHLMLVQKKKYNNLISTYVLTLGGFIFTLYSTYLTRSGVLGDTSVHAFAGGMELQLLIFLAVFTVLPFLLLILRKKKFNVKYVEDDTLSREFWIFIGSLVLILSSLQITFETSLPIFNKLFGPDGALFTLYEVNKAPALDRLAIYNSWQVPFAIVLTLIIGGIQFMSNKKTKGKKFFKAIKFPMILSLVFTVIAAFITELESPLYILLLFTSMFAIVGNFTYWRRVLGFNLYKSGTTIAHIGFGLIVLGALISNAKKEIISQNKTYIAKNVPSNENIYLEEGDTVAMGDYFVTFNGMRKEKDLFLFDVDYFERNEAGELEKSFELSPFVRENKIMGNAAEPSTKHYFHKDIYSYVAFFPKKVSEKDEYLNEASTDISPGDSVIYSNYFVKLDSLVVLSNLNDIHLDKANLALSAHFTITDMTGAKYKTEAFYTIVENQIQPIPGFVEPLGLRVTFTNIKVDEQKVEIKFAEHKSKVKDYIIMQAIVFPYINILWIGIILMFFGTLIALTQRVKKQSKA